jgi:hypothetical protein
MMTTDVHAGAGVTVRTDDSNPLVEQLLAWDYKQQQEVSTLESEQEDTTKVMHDGDQWFLRHENVVTLTSWMAWHHCSADAVAYAVEKPWKFEDEFEQAVLEQLEEA